MNNISTKVQSFCECANRELIEFHKTTSARFKTRSWKDSDLQERMMRIGCEARALGASNEDEYAEIALATLKRDFIRYS